MLCAIYKSSNKEGAYLFLPKRDDFSQLPEELLKTFGKPIFVMLVSLLKKQLLDLDNQKVMTRLTEQGFYLKLPPPPENLLEQHQALRKQLQP